MTIEAVDNAETLRVLSSHIIQFAPILKNYRIGKSAEFCCKKFIWGTIFDFLMTMIGFLQCTRKIDNRIATGVSGVK